jgi:hypothetical protein
MFGEVYRTQISCRLNPIINGSFFAVGCGCSADASEETGDIADKCAGAIASISTIPLTTSTVFCSDPEGNDAKNLAAGSATYTAASACSSSSGGTTEEKIQKVVVADATSRRLQSKSTSYFDFLGLGRRLSSCAAHEVVKSAGGKVCGQKVGTGLATELSNVALCITVNVPTSEMCSNYQYADFVQVYTNGSYGQPLFLSTSINSQGQYCATPTTAGMFLPIKRTETCEGVASGDIGLAFRKGLSMAAAIGMWLAWLA